MAVSPCPADIGTAGGRVGDHATAKSTDDLVREALGRGDRRGALSILMKTYGTELFRFCHSVVRSRSTADDVHQTTFEQAFDALDLTPRSYRAWLFGIAHHRCLDALKSDRRRTKRFILMDELPEEHDPGLSSVDRLIAGTQAAHLEECLGKLSPGVRVAVILRYQEGFTYPEMGRICREEPDTLQARVSRALPVLRKCLISKENGHEGK